VRAGAGWYRYASGDRTPQSDGTVTEIITGYAAEARIKRQTFGTDEIQARLLAAMVNEGARIVEEDIVEEDALIDVVKTAGYGFPRWRGGPMHWAEAQGDRAIRNTLELMETASPGSWVRAGRYQ